MPGTSHSAQFALAAMFKAAADGTFDFISEVKEYGRRAERLKKIFTDYGFRIVYDHDLDEPIADGFYFTIAYPGMTGGELMEELIYYGVSAISLSRPTRLYIFYQTASICPARRAPEAIQRESHRIINTGRAFIYDSLT